MLPYLGFHLAGHSSMILWSCKQFVWYRLIEVDSQYETAWRVTAWERDCLVFHNYCINGWIHVFVYRVRSSVYILFLINNKVLFTTGLWESFYAVSAVSDHPPKHTGCISCVSEAVINAIWKFTEMFHPTQQNWLKLELHASVSGTIWSAHLSLFIHLWKQKFSCNALPDSLLWPQCMCSWQLISGPWQSFFNFSNLPIAEMWPPKESYST